MRIISEEQLVLEMEEPKEQIKENWVKNKDVYL